MMVDRLAHNEQMIRQTVLPARPHLAALVVEAEARGYRPYVASALRSCDVRPEASVVYGCNSWHVLGRAIDVELWDPETGQSDERWPYEELGAWWQERGGTWGGVWVDSYPDGLPFLLGAGPGDVVHFQWTGGVHHVPDELCDPSLPCGPQAAAYIASQNGDVSAPVTEADRRVDRWLGPTALIVGSAGVAIGAGYGRAVFRTAASSAISVVAGSLALLGAAWYLGTPEDEGD